MFAPLAVDADAASMARVVAALRRRTTRREFEELAVAMLVMADADKRRRGLRSAILPLLDEELIMQSWVYKQGEARGGEARGEARGKTIGEANALLRVLRSRGLAVTDDVRDRILGCTDLRQLETWLDRALVAGRIEDVLDGH